MTPIEAGKYLCWVLRHEPDKIGLEIDRGGWADLDELVAASVDAGRDLDQDEVLAAVEADEKTRFSLSGDGLRIRANYGHSFEVDLEVSPSEPPRCLYHGTPQQTVELIRSEGLKPMQRHQVHLSEDRQTATDVGSRRGVPVVLVVDARQMYREGFEFVRRPSGVWLVNQVPPEFITVPES